MKTLVSAAALALTLAASATADTAPLRHDHGLQANGLTLQGFRVNGVSLQGINLQGLRINGTKWQGLTLQGLQGEPGAVLTAANPFAGLDAAPLGQ